MKSDLKEKLINYQAALDALLEIEFGNRYRKAINDLREDIAELTRQVDEE